MTAEVGRVASEALVSFEKESGLISLMSSKPSSDDRCLFWAMKFPQPELKYVNGHARNKKVNG